MRRKRFSPEQIIAILREACTGQETVEAVCRRHGISDTTYHRWKQLYEGQDTAEVRRARELAVENARLKRLLAERDLEIDALKSVLEKNGERATPGGGRVASGWAVGVNAYGESVR